MKNLFFVVFFTHISVSLMAQEEVPLRSVSFFPIQTTSIYIDSVFDERKIKNLGSHKNIAAEEVQLFLYKGATQAVKEFYDLSLKKDSLSKPVYIKIKSLNIQESKRRMNDGIARVGRVHIFLSFCRKQDGNLKEMYSIKHNEDEVFGLDNKSGLYATHEKRIRAALEYCMHAFLKNYEESSALVKEQSFQPKLENKNIEVKLGEWFNLITLKGMQSNYFQGYGISYTGFVDSKKGLIRPYETSFEVNWAREDVAAQNGYANVNSFVFRPELYFFYKRLFKGAYASMSANIPVGFETLEDVEGKNSFNFVIGAGASQGLRFIPWRKNGLVFGIDFFQQFETSKVYRFDFGAEVVLGLNF